MNKKKKLRFEDLPKDYAALCGMLLPRVIHNPAEYATVAEVTDAMAIWHEDFTGDQADYFDLLCWLIEEYDLKHLNRPKFTAADMLKRLMERHCLSLMPFGNSAVGQYLSKWVWQKGA
jgi:hypothetical protein